MKLLSAAFIVLSQFAGIGHAAELADRDWTIRVDVYRNFPAVDFKALSELGSVIAVETSNGFLRKSIVTRDGFHEGATFCLLINSSLGDAAQEKARILARIEALKIHGNFDEFNIAQQSSCMPSI